MSQKIMIGILSLLMVPFIQGCDERDVATGVAVGAVVGGAIVAVSTDNYNHSDYYRNRYNNYYRHRRARYSKRYGHRYGHRNRGPVYGGRKHRRPGKRRRPGYNGFNSIQAMPVALTAPSTAVAKFADFYQMPMDSAEIIWNAKQRALNGDLGGLVDIGLFSSDFQNLVSMKKASSDTVYRMSLRTGLDEDHINDILVDLQQEVYASQKAGRIHLQ